MDIKLVNTLRPDGPGFFSIFPVLIPIEQHKFQFKYFDLRRSR